MCIKVSIYVWVLQEMGLPHRNWNGKVRWPGPDTHLCTLFHNAVELQQWQQWEQWCCWWRWFGGSLCFCFYFCFWDGVPFCIPGRYRTLDSPASTQVLRSKSSAPHQPLFILWSENVPLWKASILYWWLIILMTDHREPELLLPPPAYGLNRLLLTQSGSGIEGCLVFRITHSLLCDLAISRMTHSLFSPPHSSNRKKISTVMHTWYPQMFLLLKS